MFSSIFVSSIVLLFHKLSNYLNVSVPWVTQCDSPTFFFLQVLPLAAAHKEVKISVLSFRDGMILFFMHCWMFLAIRLVQWKGWRPQVMRKTRSWSTLNLRSRKGRGEAPGFFFISGLNKELEFQPWPFTFSLDGNWKTRRYSKLNSSI